METQQQPTLFKASSLDTIINSDEILSQGFIFLPSVKILFLAMVKISSNHNQKKKKRKKRERREKRKESKREKGTFLNNVLEMLYAYALRIQSP